MIWFVHHAKSVTDRHLDRFILCNEGYTIERFIHGMEAEYNDIQTCDHQALVDVFGGAKTSKKFAVRTKDELNKLLTNAEFNAGNCLQLIEVHMPKEDAPRALIMTAEASARNNAKTA